MRKLIFLFAFITTFVFGQTPTGNRVAWTDTVKISYNNQFVDLFELMRDSINIAQDTTSLKNSTATVMFLNDSLSGGKFVLRDSSSTIAAYGGSNGWLHGKSAVFYQSGTTGKIYVRDKVLGGYQLDIRWWGAKPDIKTSAQAAINTPAIQRAINFSGFNTGFSVKIPEGNFWISKSNPGSSFCLYLFQGVKIQGTRYRTDVSSGSVISLYDNQNCVVFADSALEAASEWWHWGALEDIVINCNGTNNTTRAQALDLYQSGETTVIRNLSVRDYLGHAFEFRGSHAPLFIDNIQFGANSSASYNPYDEERVAIYINGGNGTMNFKRLSGDDNVPFILARKAAPTLYIDGFKVEGSAYAQTDSSCVIWADSIDGNTSTIQVTNYKHNASNTESIVRITQGSVATSLRPPMFFSNLFVTGAENFYITEESTPDTFSTVSSTIAALFIGGNSGSAFEIFRGGISFPDAGAGLTFYDLLGNAEGFLRHQSDDIFHLRSPSNSVVIEEDGGADLMTFTASGNTSNKLLTLAAGLKIAASSQIDTLQYKASGDSIQIYINGVGWKAFKLNSSSGN